MASTPLLHVHVTLAEGSPLLIMYFAINPTYRFNTRNNKNSNKLTTTSYSPTYHLHQPHLHYPLLTRNRWKAQTRVVSNQA